MWTDFSVNRAGGVKVPFRIGRYPVRSRAFEGANHLQVASPEDPNLRIRVITDIKIPLVSIGRKRCLTDGPGPAPCDRVLRDESLPHEGPVLAEHLDAVPLPVADVHETVPRDLNTMRRLKLSRWRAVRIECLHRAILGLPAIRAPVAFVHARRGVKHDHASIGV